MPRLALLALAEGRKVYIEIVHQNYQSLLGVVLQACPVSQTCLSWRLNWILTFHARLPYLESL